MGNTYTLAQRNEERTELQNTSEPAPPHPPTQPQPQQPNQAHSETTAASSGDVEESTESHEGQALLSQQPPHTHSHSIEAASSQQSQHQHEQQAPHIHAADRESQPKQQHEIHIPPHDSSDTSCSSTQAEVPAVESSSIKKEEADPRPQRLCRICFDDEEEEDNPLIHPCLCQGSHGAVHRKCLQTWRDTQRASNNPQAYFRCEICHYRYQYVRLDSAAFIAHPAVVFFAFVLMLLLSCTALGIVPIIQACLEAYDIPFTGLLHAVVHLCDGLMVMGLISVIMVAGASPQLARMQPARMGYHCSVLMCWFRMIGCGQVCGPIWLASLSGLAILGLVNTVPVAFMLLYTLARVLTGATVRMVENVDPKEARAQVKESSAAAAAEAAAAAPAAAGPSGSNSSDNNNDSSSEQQPSASRSATAV